MSSDLNSPPSQDSMILKATQDAFAAADIASLKLAYWNDAFSAWVNGATSGTVADAIPKLERATLEAALSKKGEFFFETEVAPEGKRRFPARYAFRKIASGGRDWLLVHGSDWGKVIEKDLMLKSISKLLEQKSKQIEAQKNSFQSILDNAAQGFFTFDKNLAISGDLSKKALEMMGEEIAGQDVCDVLKLDKESFAEYAALAFQGAAWDLLKPLSVLETQLGPKVLKVEFVPIVEEGAVVRMMGTVSDITQLRELERKADETSQTANAIVSILESKPLFLEVLDILDRMILARNGEADAKRDIHTLKGGLASLGFKDLASRCDLFEEEWPQKYSAESLKAFAQGLKTKINTFLDKYDKVLRVRQSSRDEVVVSFSNLVSLVRLGSDETIRDSIVRSIEAMVERPFHECIGWLNAVWTANARKLGKEVNPITWPDAIPIWPDPYRKLFSSLIHIARNSADHGIERPEERVAAGKPRAGSLRLSLALQGDTYHLRFKDDGRGADIDRIREIAQKRGMVVPKERERVLNLIFEPEFTVKDKATELSGRGVGLDAVKVEAIALHGGIEAHSDPGKGLEIHIWFKKHPLPGMS
jgi:HPt (histidine-containing phosphotransfer) domain-containing protein/PAS domain-containing protein